MTPVRCPECSGKFDADAHEACPHCPTVLVGNSDAETEETEETDPA